MINFEVACLDDRLKFLEHFPQNGDLTLQGALKTQVQRFWEKMLHGKKLQAIEH